MATFLLSAFADECGGGLLEQVRALKENNLTHIEPRGLDAGNISKHTPAMAKEIKKVLDDNGIGVSAIGSPFGKIFIEDDFNEHFESFKNTVEIANILGTQRIRMFSFYMDEDECAEKRDAVFERLETLADYSLKHGVYCCHENEKGIYGDNDDRCLDILKTFEGKIKGIFDPANFIQCGVKIIPAFEKLEPYIDYMHIKDCRYEDGRVVPAGKGDGEIVELLRRFNKKDGAHFLTLEPHLKVFKGLEELEKSGETAQQMDDFEYPTKWDSFNAACDALHEVLARI